MLHLSTDCSIVMGAGGSPRVGSASMDEIKLTAELLAEGWSSAELDRLARSGEVQRIRRGAYECGPTRSLDLRDQHRRLIAATVRQTAVDAAVSHMSAAVLHQLPIWNNELERVHITRHQSGGGKIRRLRYVTSAGRSSAGSGKTSTTPRSCGAGWSGRSNGACALPEGF